MLDLCPREGPISPVLARHDQERAGCVKEATSLLGPGSVGRYFQPSSPPEVLFAQTTHQAEPLHVGLKCGIRCDPTGQGRSGSDKSFQNRSAETAPVTQRPGQVVLLERPSRVEHSN